MNSKETRTIEVTPTSREKTTTYEQAAQLIKRLREQEKTVVYLSGVFDVVHTGHADFLRGAKQAGDILVVGIESDKTVRHNKGEQRPVHTSAQRAHMLSEFESVDFVFAFEDIVDYNKGRETYVNRFRTLNPDFVAFSSIDENLDPKMEAVQQAGVDIALIHEGPQNTSSKILHLIGYE